MIVFITRQRDSDGSSRHPIQAHSCTVLRRSYWGMRCTAWWQLGTPHFLIRRIGQ